MTKARLLKPFPFRLHIAICILYLLWMGFLNIYDYGWKHLPVVLPVGILILLTVYLHRYLLRQILVVTARPFYLLIGFGTFVFLITAVYTVLYHFPNSVTDLLHPDPSVAPDLPGYVINFMMVYGTAVFRGIGLTIVEILYNIVCHLSTTQPVPKRSKKKKSVPKTEKLLHTLERMTLVLETLVKDTVEKDTMTDHDGLPSLVSLERIYEYLNIHSSNFYRNVNKILLEPILYIGARPYYLKEELAKLFKRHESGSHTYAKAKKAKKKNCPEKDGQEET